MNLASKLGVAALAAALTAGLTVPAATAGNAPVERKAAYKPTLKASAKSVEAGKKLVLSGKVKPATKGATVIVQRKLAGKPWVKTGKTAVKKSGAFTFTDKPNVPGVRQYRVVVPKVGKVKAGKSKPVKVTVLTWRALSTLPFRQQESTRILTNASIAGTSYSGSIGPIPGAAEGTADWNIPTTCTSLRVRLGNGDQTDVGAQANITLDGGPGQFVHTGSYGLGKSELKTFDVSNVLRLTFTWTSTVGASPVPAAGAQPLLAQPELLCSTP
ncbi:hypothetical protein GCM10023350_10810 [Nocardioides endophyticus]|uniref:Uncharacterized protein n=1 Tax=Nocardioides endophyticus TaxID=1353775 RepID=A0ABP8YGA6_9ACTN